MFIMGIPARLHPPLPPGPQEMSGPAHGPQCQVILPFVERAKCPKMLLPNDMPHLRALCYTSRIRRGEHAPNLKDFV